MSGENKQPASATTGVDSLGKILRRNLSTKRLRLLWGRGKETLQQRGWQALGREVSFRFRLAAHQEIWRYRADIPLNRELKAQRAHPFENPPLISVVCPLYNTPLPFLREMIQSVLQQSYAHLQLVLVNASQPSHPQVERTVLALAQKDPRIVYIPLPENLGIAQNTNAGLAACTGDWICLLDHDDKLQKSALFEVAQAALDTGAELIYSDEVVLNQDMTKLKEFHFKGDFGPDTLRGCNYITHLCAFTRDLLQRAGGPERPEFDGAQDYDLILRLSEQARCIHHIPKVLYFWRSHEGSTASDIGQKPAAIAAGAQALQQHVDRLGLAGAAAPLPQHPGAYRVQFEVTETPLVSVLIPSCDHTQDLDRCLESLLLHSGWQNLEILVLDNNSKDPATPLYYESLAKHHPQVRVLHYEGAFNYSAINNFGAEQARGAHLLLLNNDVEILPEDFVREMLSFSQRPDVGAVGAKLFYPDDTIQHAGLIVGIGGTAGVSHKGHPREDGGDMFRLCTVQNVSAVTGAALMVKTDLYRQMGGLDEKNFAVAFNDVDFCLRLLGAGHRNVFTPFAQAYHFESKSRGYDTQGEKKLRFEKERANFQNQWAEFLAQGDPFYNPHLTLEYENFGYR